MMLVVVVVVRQRQTTEGLSVLNVTLVTIAKSAQPLLISYRVSTR